MAEVIRRKLRPGETIFGGGAGFVSWNIYPKKRSPSATAGSPPARLGAGDPQSADPEDMSLAPPRPSLEPDPYPIEEMVRLANLKLMERLDAERSSASASTSRKSDADN